MGKRSKAIRNKNKQNKQKSQVKVKPMKQYTNYNTYESKAGCHTGHNLIFKTSDGIEVWAGGKNRQGGWQKMSPLPQLAMGPSETLVSYSASSKTDVPEGWSCEQHLENTTPPPMLSLDWPDFSIPKVSKYFWYAVIDDIREMKIKSISTQCAGGHGRTGVQLAILAYLLGTKEERVAWPDAGVLIDWVRDMHCTHAVESKDQQQYIADVCGIPHGTDKVVSTGGFGWSDNTKWDGGKGKVSGPTDAGRELIIDEVGADYCPHCKNVPVGMIAYGMKCNKCGEDPQEYDESVGVKYASHETLMKNDDSPDFDDEEDILWSDDDDDDKLFIPECPSCKSIDVHDESKTCLDCHYDLTLEDTPYKSTVECQACGDYYDHRNMDSTIGFCYPCSFEQLKITKAQLKVKMDSKLNAYFTIACGGCKKPKDSRYIKKYSASINAFVCYECEKPTKPTKPTKEAKVCKVCNNNMHTAKDNTCYPCHKDKEKKAVKQ